MTHEPNSRNPMGCSPLPGSLKQAGIWLRFTTPKSSLRSDFRYPLDVKGNFSSPWSKPGKRKSSCRLRLTKTKRRKTTCARLLRNPA
jgi:hypothetical protein